LKNKQKLIWALILVAALGLAGYQYSEKSAMENYLNRELNQRLGVMNNQISILHLVTENAVKEKEISRISLNEMATALEVIREESTSLHFMARDLQGNDAERMHGITHNTTKFMETRLHVLLEEIGGRNSLTLNDNALRTIDTIRETSGHWEEEHNESLSGNYHIFEKEWIDLLVKMEDHSAQYQQVMDGNENE
jgi:hypothetical protein